MFFMVAISVTTIAFGQEIDKLSAGTKMFLQQRAIRELQDTAILKKSPYASPKAVNGVEYINCFINLIDGASIGELEALGVKVNGVYEHFVTAKVPVEKIDEVAKLGNVKQISVSRKMKMFTDQACSITNADKVWDGTNNGLPEEFTGKDVVLGIIDDGIEFNHTAFKDASGNSRVKAVYRPNQTSASTGGTTVTIDGVTLSGYQYTTTTGISALTTDDTEASHGTHTTGCAAGSKVGNYSGMAPESDLVLCGAGEGNGLTDDAILNSAKYIANYAKSVGKPCVISISLGSETGPHDGKSYISLGYDQIAEQYGAIILLAAGNEADCTGYATKTLSSSSDAMAVIHTPISSMSSYGLYIYGICDVWNSTSDQLKVQVKVLNSSGTAVYTSDAMSNGTISASTLSNYFTSVSNGGIEIAGSVDANNGRYNLNIVPYLGTNKGSYKLAYVITGSAGNVINVFTENNYSQLASSGSISGYTLSKGQNDGTMCDDMTGNNTISVGAMCSRLSVPTNYGSRTSSLSNSSYSQGDIAYFSSYGTDYNGVNHPFITAPGHSVVSSLNRHDTSGYISTSYCSYRYSLGSNTYDYWGWMSGTSMATPISAGVVALYLQADPTLDVAGVKDVIKNTATSYSNPSSPDKQRGNGIINALAGIEYILNNTTTPKISASPTSIDFGNVTAGGTATQTFTVTATNLEGNITLTKSGSNYSIDKTSISKNSDGTASATVTVTFSPAANVSQTYNGTVTLTSSNATSVTVSLTGKGVYNAPTIAANPTSLSFTGNSGSTYTKTVTVTGSNLQGNITAAIQNDVNGFYSVSPASFNAASQIVTVTWAPTAGGTSTANLVLTTTGTGANTVTVPITGTAQGPTITANPTSLTFSGYATQTYTQTVTVTGTNLSQNITASLTGANIYSIDKTSLTKAGGTITVTYAPTDAGNTSATLTLSSTGASTVTVPITGTAQAATPTLIVVPTSLTFSPDVNTPESKTFAVTGRFINEDVTITLNDPSGVFTLEQATIPAASISETDAVNVTVTFQSADEGDYTGSVTVASNGATSQTVNLSATISTGGAASDNYLNIAKYATIDEAGATVSGMSSIYKYTEYADDACAWLTISNYGANQADANQKWYNVNNLRGYSNSWSASDVFLGDDAYFGSNSSYSVYGSGYQIFYVTNCTQAKALVKGGSYSSSNATLSIYECTKNADGTLNASSTATTTQSGSNGVITSATLDASKIYKVQLSGGGSYPDLLEIGFQTPLNKPSLTASPTGIDFIAEPGETITETITVTGARLTEDVTVTLTDENGVYTLDKKSISIAEATNGATVTVTFNAPQAMGSYRGQATFTSGQASAKTVFYGAVGEKGTAYSNYLDIAQYQTIATGNWYDGIFANAYKWTEYEDDECAWLTLPAALPYYAWNYNDQNWCGVSSNSTGGWYGHQWTATDVFQGYEYFQGTFENETDTYAHMMGGSESNSTSNTTIFYGIYNVTNCTQVKAYAYNNSGVSSSYPAFIQIYELTENADGTLTRSETRTDIQSSTTSGAVTMTSAELDASKIYFVAVGGYRGFTYEVAFRTPLTTVEATLAQIEASGVKNQKYKISDKLLAVYAAGDQGILWCKDLNNASIAPTYQTYGQYDYMRDIVGEQSNDWDQSNWVALQFSAPTSTNGVKALIQGAVGSYIKAGTIVGTYSDLNNYTITMAEDALLLETCDEAFVKNVYCTANFLPNNLNINGGQGAPGRYHGEDVYYFFMNPKVQEVCEITYALWDGEKFVVPDNDSQIDGAFTVDWTLNEEGPITPTTGEAYRFVAVVNRTQNSGYLKSITGEPSSDFIITPLNFTGSGNQVITAINGIYTDSNRDVVGVEYVNAAGIVSKTPFQGMNIVVTRFSDGSKTTSKKVFK